MRKKNKLKRPALTKAWSLGFYLAVPTCFTLAFVCLAAILMLVAEQPFPKERAIIFASGFASSSLLISSFRLQRTRLFLHELRHAVVIVLTGNSLKEFKVGRNSGEVRYELLEDRDHFHPLITVAPYFLPIFSAPVLVTALFVAGDYLLLFSFVLGVMFALDLLTSLGELGPHQEDLRLISGGFLASGAFIGSAHFLWSMLVMLWVVGGRSGYAYALYLMGIALERLSERLS